MVRIECDSERIDGVRLVTCRLATDARVRVTVEPAHDGPVWPPRRQGVPAPGWDDGAWTGVVHADAPRGLGYATPTAVDGGSDGPDGDDSADGGEESEADRGDDSDGGDGEGPATITAVEPAEAGDGPVSPRDVIRALGDSSPARDAVPDPSVEATAAETPGDLTTDASPAAADGTETPSGRATEAVADRPRDGEGRGDHDGPEAAERDCDRGGWETPEPVAGAARLDAIERRLETAADLAAVSTPAEARTAVAGVGGVAAVRSLVERLEDDRAYLRQVDERTDALAERARETTVPLAALERLA